MGTFAEKLFENIDEDTVKSVLDGFLSIEDAKKLPLIDAIKETIRDVYLPKEYSFAIYVDHRPQEYVLHCRVNKVYQFQVSLDSLRSDNNFLRKNGKYYRLFPQIHECIDIAIRKIERDQLKPRYMRRPTVP